ncbi:helix-turn-helix domain-containing protein [Phenylobacterium sp.]|uniref:helix-turn-helix domain-containing protein n=1 Tax=Phenylobacterium sp. TaxID=1871053 RepID=UPI0025E2582A|nr:helix-turn-helix domain-containing protein [Phenylobacterium sp.]MBX3484763.1 transcriptional regulator [Phenylobacterium sp.]
MTMDIRPIRTASDHEAALREIDRLWGAEVGSDDGDRLDVLATLVERYEEGHFPIPTSTPLEVLKFMMEQTGRRQTDLANLLGSRSRASEILSGRRNLTLDQIRLLAREWRIPAGALVGELEPA